MNKFIGLMALLLLVGCEEPAVEGSEVQTNDGGRTLFAEYLRADSDEQVPVMILMHQPGAEHDREDFDLIWSGLSQVGFGLLSLDLSSHGDSQDLGSIEELSTDPDGWPTDLEIWLRWLQRRVDEDDEPIDVNSVGVIGLGTSGSIAAAAVGAGLVDCAVAVSPTRTEIDTLAPGFFEDGDPVDLQFHDILWASGTEDEPSTSDVAELEAETEGATRSVRVPGPLYGREVLSDDPDVREQTILWCTDKV